jgi:hypothetical protein
MSSSQRDKTYCRLLLKPDLVLSDKTHLDNWAQTSDIHNARNVLDATFVRKPRYVPEK